MAPYARHPRFHSKRIIFSFLLATLLLGLIVILSGSAPSSASVADSPPTLSGEVAAYPPQPGSLVVTATGTPCTTYSFSVTATASGPYNGTFTATGTFALQPITPDPLAPNITHRVISWTETFTINQPVSALPPQPVAHVITGTKQLDPTANDSIVNVAQCSDTLINPSPVVTTYQATITGADGTFTDSGVAQSGITEMPFNPGAASFFENFTSSQATTSPVGDGDGDGVPDSQDACPNTPPNTPVNAAGCPVGACFPPPASMVSWWPGDGNANDIQDGNNGTLQGGATATAPGKVAQTFSFNGSSGFVSIGNPANLKISGALTIDAWINPSAAPSAGLLKAIVTKWAQDFSTSPTSDSYGLWIVNGSFGNPTSDGTIRLVSAIHKTTGSEPVLQGGTIPLNAWSHVAMTFDPTSGAYAIYINGQPVASTTSTGNNLATDRNVSIGREESSLPRYFTGLIDEVEIFNRALSPAEINAIYLADGSGKCKAVDTDGDGVPDDTDACPTDPGKTVPGACGCGAADTDSDGDGTADCNDQCPNDGSKTGRGACGCGVADTDTDNDGTPDCNDACPNDPNKLAPGVCGCGVADTDTDNDGTPDCNDACPNDPNKLAPGVCGCGVADTDTDGDGTPNCNDACPNDPGKINPGACGCGVADADSDHDGTPDCHDSCPTDPIKIAPGVCGCGVPDTDSDGDGIPNCQDNCPNTFNPNQSDSDNDGVGDACAFQFPNGGQFVIGDQVNVGMGATVYFWGSQWAQNNPMSDGDAPNTFKGFENGSQQPACGGAWSSQPGNSSNPPSSIPQFMAVIVSSSIQKNGSVITGNVNKIVIIQTNSGYGPSPGRPGTGRVIAIYCVTNSSASLLDQLLNFGGSLGSPPGLEWLSMQPSRRWALGS